MCRIHIDLCMMLTSQVISSHTANPNSVSKPNRRLRTCFLPSTANAAASVASLVVICSDIVGLADQNQSLRMFFSEACPDLSDIFEQEAKQFSNELHELPMHESGKSVLSAWYQLKR